MQLPNRARGLLYVVASILLMLIVGGFSAAQTLAAPPKGRFGGGPIPYKVGDRVAWEFAGKQHPGTITAINAALGLITLKLDDGQFGGEHTGPVTDFRKLAKPKPDSSAKAKTDSVADSGHPRSEPAAEENPFETPEERANKRGPRTWSDRTGKFKIEATLVKQDEDSVTLKRKADGKEVTLPRDKLSDEDQQYLRGGPAAAASTKDKGASGEETRDEDGFLISKADATRARPLNVGRTSAWSYEADAGPPQKLPEVRIALGPKDVFEKPQIFVSPEKLSAVVIWVDNFKTKKARIQSCNLKTETLESSGDFVPGLAPLAISGQMTRVVASKIEDKDRNILYLYDVQGKKVKPRVSWRPHGSDDPHKQKVEFAQFVDEDHLLTVSNDHVCVLWNLADKIEPVYQIPKAEGKKVALSATKKYLACVVDDGIAIIQTLTGKRAGFLGGDELFAGTLAFSPQGQQLALVSWGRVRVWDLATRELVRDFDGGALGLEQVTWTDENTLLLDGKVVIDVPHRVKIWTYTESSPGILVGANYLYVETGQNCVLASGQVPNDEARSVVKGIEPDDLLVIQPGGTVTLEVQVPGYEQYRTQIIDSLKKQLEANGMRVADGSLLKLVVSTQAGDTKQILTRQLGRGPRTVEAHQVATQTTSIAYQADGKVLWIRQGEVGAHFGFIQMKRGETVDAALARNTDTRVANLGGTRIPKYVAQLPLGKTSGTSKSP